MGNVNKLLLDINGRSLIEHVVDAITASSITEIIIVVGHDREDVVSALDGYKVRFVENPDFIQGISTSIRAGLGAISGNPDAVMVSLGDMPLVTSETINALITAYNPEAKQEICVPVYQGKRGNPVLWSSRFIHEMMLLSGDKGARDLLTRHQEIVQDVIVHDSGVVVDFDNMKSFDAEKHIK